MDELLKHLNIRFADCDTSEECWRWVQRLATRDTVLAQEVAFLKRDIAELKAAAAPKKDKKGGSQ